VLEVHWELLLVLDSRLAHPWLIIDSLPRLCFQVRRETCFSTLASNCGNGLVELDEECDCGEDCDQTLCCNSECKLDLGLILEHFGRVTPLLIGLR